MARESPARENWHLFPPATHARDRLRPGARFLPRSSHRLDSTMPVGQRLGWVRRVSSGDRRASDRLWIFATEPEQVGSRHSRERPSGVAPGGLFLPRPVNLGRAARTQPCWGFEGPAPKPTPPSDHIPLERRCAFGVERWPGNRRRRIVLTRAMSRLINRTKRGNFRQRAGASLSRRFSRLYPDPCLKPDQETKCEGY